MTFFEFVKKHRLATKLVALILAVSTAVTTVVTCVTLYLDYARESEELVSELENAMVSHGPGLSHALWNFDTNLIERELNGIVAVPGLPFAEVVTSFGARYTAGKRPEVTLQEKVLELVEVDSASRPKGDQLGTLTIVASGSIILDHLKSRVITIFISQFFKTILVSAILFVLIQIKYISVIEKISQFFDSAKSDKTFRRRIVLNRGYGSKDELDNLAANINQMLDYAKANLELKEKLNVDLGHIVGEQNLQLQSDRMALEQAARLSAVGQMAGGIAHEIANPILVMKGKLFLLRKKIKAANIEDGEKDIDILESLVDRITATVKSVRAMSRVTGNEPMAEEKLSAVVQDVWDLVASRLRNQSVGFEVSPELAYYQVGCRRVQIGQVLVNLVSNGMDAIEGTPKQWIKIGVRESADKLLVLVVDSGLGIPKDIQEKMMTPYFTSKPVGQGTGIGLSISRKIMAEHGGEVQILNGEPNTTLALVFPKFEKV